MIPHADRRVAVIGAGIAGIAAANMLKKQGYDVVVFEKAASLGGVWAVAYRRQAQRTQPLQPLLVHM